MEFNYEDFKNIYKSNKDLFTYTSRAGENRNSRDYYYSVSRNSPYASGRELSKDLYNTYKTRYEQEAKQASVVQQPAQQQQQQAVAQSSFQPSSSTAVPQAVAQLRSAPTVPQQESTIDALSSKYAAELQNYQLGLQQAQSNIFTRLDQQQQTQQQNLGNLFGDYGSYVNQLAGEWRSGLDQTRTAIDSLRNDYSKQLDQTKGVFQSALSASRIEREAERQQRYNLQNQLTGLFNQAETARQSQANMEESARLVRGDTERQLFRKYNRANKNRQAGAFTSYNTVQKGNIFGR